MNSSESNTLSLHKYNLWFVKLRFYAFFSLLFYYFFLKFVFQFSLSITQDVAIISTSLMILIYNLLLCVYFRKKDLTESYDKLLRVELFQTILDLISLSVLVYFTGGLESPIFLFFIFHMIIGSLILPTKLVYFIASVLIIIFSILSMSEYFGYISHKAIIGFYREPLFNDLNFVIGFLIVFSFVLIFSIYLTSKIVHELYLRENQLQNTLNQLRESERSKQKFIMATVHEIKSPISAVTSFIDVVLGGYTGIIEEGTRDKLMKARSRSTEAINTINSVLRISKFRLLNKIEEKKINIISLIKNVFVSYQSWADRKEIIIRFENDLDEIIVSADEVLLKLVFSNIIGNAVKYTDNGGEILVSLHTKKKLLIIDISDDGIGIPAKDQEKIFEEYYRASNAIESNIEGTGTGLNIVKEIIESHNGKVKLSSPSKIRKEGRPGTTINIIMNLM